MQIFYIQCHAAQKITDNRSRFCFICSNPQLSSFIDSTIIAATLPSGPFKNSGKRQFSSLIDASLFSRTCRHMSTQAIAPEMIEVFICLVLFVNGKCRKQPSDTLKEFCSFLKAYEYLDTACLGIKKHIPRC